MNVILVCRHPTVVHGRVYDCGRCQVCRRKRAALWSMRLTDQATVSNTHGFWFTLTYKDDHLPVSDGIPVLRKSDLQKYFKRVRIHLVRRGYALKFKYYACGEYGTRNGRPHYHVCVIGLPFSFALFFSSAWSFGFVRRLEPINFAEFGKKAYFYISSYTSKRLRGSARKCDSRSIEPEFQCHSRFIGNDFIAKDYKICPVFRDLFKEKRYFPISESVDYGFRRVNGQRVMLSKPYRDYLGIPFDTYNEFLQQDPLQQRLHSVLHLKDKDIIEAREMSHAWVMHYVKESRLNCAA